MLSSTVAGEPITERSALGILDVLACVRLLAESACILPLHCYRETESGRQRFHGKLSDLLERPAPGSTQANLVSQMVGSLALRGECFIGKFRSGGEITQIGVLPVDRLTKVEHVRGEPRFTLTHPATPKRSGPPQTEHGPEDILHIRGLSLDGIRGISPIGYAREALGLATILQEHASSLFANSAVPKGVLSVPPSSAQTDIMENLKEQWESRHGGARNSGRVAVLAGEIDFKPVSVTPADAEFLGQRKLSTQEIARLFKVPAHMINGEAGTSLHYSTTEMDALNFVKFSLAPHLTVIEQAITADEDLTPPGVYCQFTLDALLRADSHTRAQVYALALDPEKGWLNRDEVRELEDRPREQFPPPHLPSRNGTAPIPTATSNGRKT